ncbi:MAG: hypothetical protein HY725_19345 [Candidatus Rokubacteria bacterium]|nr:hypothetical protein [Candidatus Rokubacteria bacterium]
MLDEPVSAVLVDSALLRLPAADQAKLFDAVAPGVLVVVFISEEASPAERVRHEVLGFQVFSKPFPVEDLLEKVEALTLGASLRGSRAS